MGQLKNSLIDKCEEVHTVLNTFAEVSYDKRATRAIVASCPTPAVAREVTQAINNRAIKGTKVITSLLFPKDVFIAINLH